MFTGIVEETGRVTSVPAAGRAGRLAIKASRVLEGTRIGDSIAVNGVCLTATELLPDGFAADVMPQTLSHSNLGALRAGSPVNLERAMAADGRFGGHIVSGHIDGTGTVRRVRRDQNAVRFTIGAPAGIMALIVAQGSITVDGISLTVAYVDDRCFKVSIIPHTGQETTLLTRKPGYVVNLECDIVGKYIEKLMKPAPEADKPSGGLTADFLSAHGFL